MSVQMCVCAMRVSVCEWLCGWRTEAMEKQKSFSEVIFSFWQLVASCEKSSEGRERKNHLHTVKD